MKQSWAVVSSLWLLIAVYSWTTMDSGKIEHETLTAEFPLPDDRTIIDQLIEKMQRDGDKTLEDMTAAQGKSPIYLDDDVAPMTAFTDCEDNGVGRKCATRQDRI